MLFRFGQVVEILLGLFGIEAVGVQAQEASEDIPGRGEILFLLVTVGVRFILELTHSQSSQLIQRLHSPIRIWVLPVQLAQSLGATQIIAYPDVSPEWFENVDAGSLVPKSVCEVGQTIDEMVAMWNMVYGYFGYCEMTNNPAAVNAIAGYYGLPLIKVPLVVVNGTVA